VRLGWKARQGIASYRAKSNFDPIVTRGGPQEVLQEVLQTIRIDPPRYCKVPAGGIANDPPEVLQTIRATFLFGPIELKQKIKTHIYYKNMWQA